MQGNRCEVTVIAPIRRKLEQVRQDVTGELTGRAQTIANRVSQQATATRQQAIAGGSGPGSLQPRARQIPNDPDIARWRTEPQSHAHKRYTERPAPMRPRVDLSALERSPARPMPGPDGLPVLPKPRQDSHLGPEVTEDLAHPRKPGNERAGIPPFVPAPARTAINGLPLPATQPGHRTRTKALEPPPTPIGETIATTAAAVAKSSAQAVDAGIAAIETLEKHWPGKWVNTSMAVGVGVVAADVVHHSANAVVAMVRAAQDLTASPPPPQPEPEPVRRPVLGP